MTTIPEFTKKYVQLGDDKLNTVTTFKYLGSIFDSNGGAERDINGRNGSNCMTGVLCDKKVPIKLKDKVYKTVIKPTKIYGAECWAVRKKDKNRLHVAEMRMLRWIRGKTRKDHTYIHTYPLRSSGLFRPMYRSMCWHVQLHAHASPVPYSCKETSHSASDSLIDVLTCLD